MSAKLEQLLALLSDNVWHNIDETAKTLEIPQDKLQQIIKFLTETDLIQHNPATNQIKLNQNWKTLIINQKETNQETNAQPETTAVGTIIIPPQNNPIHTHNKPNRQQPRTRNPHKQKTKRNSHKQNQVTNITPKQNFCNNQKFNLYKEEARLLKDYAPNKKHVFGCGRQD